MIKQDFYIANLIARYLSEEITPEETIKLTAWREESTAHEILFKKICNEENQKQHFRKNTAFNPFLFRTNSSSHNPFYLGNPKLF